MDSKPKHCKDCEPGSKRPALKPGPRCATHYREFVKAQKKRTAERRDLNVYGLQDGEYDTLYRLQGGRCAICQRATGATRRLSVDHDHATGKVRGLLCRPCNSMLGHGRDDMAFFRRALDYLWAPPYSSMNTPTNRSTHDD